jgi:hypothetical protein
MNPAASTLQDKPMIYAQFDRTDRKIQRKKITNPLATNQSPTINFFWGRTNPIQVQKIFPCPRLYKTKENKLKTPGTNHHRAKDQLQNRKDTRPYKTKTIHQPFPPAKMIPLATILSTLACSQVQIDPRDSNKHYQCRHLKIRERETTSDRVLSGIGQQILNAKS